MSYSQNRTSPSSTASRQVTQDSPVSLFDIDGTAGSTATANHTSSRERQISADRKRRHTGVEHERRLIPPYIPHMADASRGPPGPVPGLQPGNSSANAIDLTAPPRPPRESRPMSAQHPQPPRSLMGSANMGDTLGGAREVVFPRMREGAGDGVLPRWQPDSDVSQCPVCESDFTFWNRRHHCRKCGRVVCSACSPHRITIPRQYIVQPPTGSEEEPFTGPLDQLRNPALGGGETVRVCNPCVPDPWTPHEFTSDRLSSSNARQDTARTGVLSFDDWLRRTGVSPQERNDLFQRRENFNGRNRAYSHQIAAPASRAQDSRAPARPPMIGLTTEQLNRTMRPGAGPIPHRHTHSTGSPSLAYSSQAPGYRRVAPPPSHIATIPPPLLPPHPHASSRREVREEDECPVCGNEMPPGEALREVHIQDCIANRFSSTPTQPARFMPPTSTSLPSSSAMDSGMASGSSFSPPAPGLSRPRAPSYRPRGMAISRATEKDCVTEDGEPQECVICFEEFQPGDELGRMECLCKFHRACIRQWWDTKGAGSCPTHILHEE